MCTCATIRKWRRFFGSYDDTPTDRGFVSRYKNLLHHYVHQTARREASTFWTGLGAVRGGEPTGELALLAGLRP